MLDDFLLRAVAAGLGIAFVAGPVGCFIIWRRLAYFGETVAHSGLLGVAAAILMGINLTLGIFAVAALMVFAMFYLERRDALPTDTLLGLLSHGGLAVGIVILSFFPHVRLDLHALLFGDILAVSRLDLALVWFGGAFVLAVLWRIWRALIASTVSVDLASVAGLKPDRAKLVFGILLAAVIAFSIKIVGVLLIVALLIIPAATVRRFSSGPEGMAVAAAAAGSLAVLGGLYSSANYDTPSGPSIVVASLALFIVTRIGRSKPG